MTLNPSSASKSISPGRQVLSNTAFKRLWAIGGASTAMRWLDTVAVGAFVLQLTGSPFDVALTFFFRMIPMFALGAYIGAVSDRLNRRIILIAAFAIIAFVYLLLAIAVFVDVIRVWHVYLGALLSGCVWATDFPVRRAMVGEVVPRLQLSAAMGLDLATSNFMRIPGPFIGGLLLDTVGMTAVYSLGAVLFLVATVVAVSLQYTPVAKSAVQISPLRNIVEGVRYIRRDTVIVTVLVITIVMNMFAFPYQSMVPVIAERKFGVSNTLMGLLISAEGLGATLGALWVASRATPALNSRIYFWGSVFFLVMLLAFSRVPWYAAALPILFFGGFGMSGFGTMQSIMIISTTPAEMRGRVLGVLAVTIGTGPVAALGVGAIAEVAGASAAVMFISLGGLVMLGLTAFLSPTFLKLRNVKPLEEREADLREAMSSGIAESEHSHDEDSDEHNAPYDNSWVKPTHLVPPTGASASQVSTPLNDVEVEQLDDQCNDGRDDTANHRSSHDEAR